MEVVYFFCKSDAFRVPLFSYDRRLFCLLAGRGGVWDKWRGEFVFKGMVNAEQFSLNLPGFTCVWVYEKSSVPIRLFGFWERIWEGGLEDCPAKLDRKKPAGFQENVCLPAEPSAPFEEFIMPSLLRQPEKFPEHWRLKLEAELRSRKYSLRTLRSYVYYNRLLCCILQKLPEAICPEDITQFLAIIEKEREYSASSLNLAISAVKFFYKNVLKNANISEHHRPRNDKRLPLVLSKEEISKILGMEHNPKHRLLLMLVYSSGLRVSEVVALKREHIDLSRKVIYIRLGKGRKDRCTLLSEKAAHFICEYCAFYGIQTWLFPGQSITRPLTIRSAQYIFDKAIYRTGIPKKISIHSLRHSFATHLLESGTDIRYIQSLLGHATLRTTERYTHIARRSILSIQSPLDTILQIK